MFCLAAHQPVGGSCWHRRNVRHALFRNSSALASPSSRVSKAEPHPARLDHRKVLCSSSVEAVTSTEPGLVFTAGDSECWDEGGVGSPVVSCFVGDNEQRWFMWYSGWKETKPIHSVLPSSGSVGVACSSDGVNWERVQISDNGPAQKGSAIQANEDWWTFDTCHLAASDVQILSNSSVSDGIGVYWMFYSGGSFEDAVAPNNMPGVREGEKIEGLRMRPGLAMSQNGYNWARIEGAHYTGALFEEDPDEKDWDELFGACPQVVNAGPRDLRMYYHSFDKNKGRYVIGLAKSKDGFEWKKSGPVLSGGEDSEFDGKGVASPFVTKDVDSGKFLMFYEAVDSKNERSVGLAVSDDGLMNWNRHPRPVLSKSGGSGWDCGSIGSPWAVSMAGGRWRLYYAARKDATGSWDGIGLALSVTDGETFEGIATEFKRRTGKS
ncbi:hypothetical protein BSKO_04244 [Bryopsis sp. KO-2023]|nr:hypothetical protein BSKO_04244 [Bryopsis sp. KO-2023]